MTDATMPRTRLPFWLYLAAAFGVTWNVFGLVQLADFVGQTRDSLMMKGMTPAAADLYYALPAWMKRVIVILMNCQHDLRRIHHRNAHRPNFPEEPVVIACSPDDKGRNPLVQQVTRKNEIIDPLRRPKPAAFAGHGTKALAPVRL